MQYDINDLHRLADDGCPHAHEDIGDDSGEGDPDAE